MDKKYLQIAGVLLLCGSIGTRLCYANGNEMVHQNQEIESVQIPINEPEIVVENQDNEDETWADNNKESEVVSPLSTIKQAMQEVLSQSGNSSNRVIHITATLDKRVIFEEMIDEGRTQAVINGNNPFDIGYVGV